MRRSPLRPIPVAVLLAVAVLSGAAAMSSVNPCHPLKGRQGRDVTCSHVRLPPRLCRKCKLRPPKANGEFADCTNIYKLNKGCKDTLQEYAKLNEQCDPVRAAQVKKFSDPANKMGLDYFIYSVCEQCCDCVPRGSVVEDFRDRRINGTLLSVYRGNCPAHAHYDICKVWPKVRSVGYYTGPGTGEAPKQAGVEVCPRFKKWIERPANSRWVREEKLKVGGNLARFLNQLMVAGECAKGGVWKPCVGLEGKQKRL